VGVVRSQAPGFLDDGAPCARVGAAHATLPHLGQGANQAIEDGVALAVFLEERDPAEIADVLRQYEAFRRGRTDVI
jgi:salicylate hydroxylase